MTKFILLFLLFSLSVPAQFVPSEFEGFFRGTWFNNTFQSTDSAFINIDINEANNTIEIIMDLEGNVFGGSDPEAATMNGTYDQNGFSVSGNSPSYGDMFFSGTANGNMTGRMPNVPSAFVDSTTLSGTYDKDSINLVYLVFFGGSQFADGVINVKKDLSTNIDELTGTINNFYLYQNYPNPFNPSTKIQFVIPHQSFAQLEIFNSIGENVSRLVSETLSAGSYEYEWDAAGLPSGIYFYTLRSGDFAQTKKLMLMK